MTFRFLYLPFLLLLCLHGFSQQANYRFRFVGLPEAFKNQFMTFVDEDTAGMLWFNTNNGLYRFDGRQVLTFDMQSTPALPDINIRHLLADTRSNVWVATGKGLIRFSLKSWTMQRMQPPPGQAITSLDQVITTIAEGKNGTIYAGSITGRLFLCKDSYLQPVARLRAPLNDSTGGLPDITNMIETAPSTVWLSTSKGQVVRVSVGQKSTIRYYEPRPLQGAIIDFMSIGKKGSILLSMHESKVYLLDTATVAAVPLNHLSQLASFGKDLNNLAIKRGNKMAYFFAGNAGFCEYDFNNYSFRSFNTPYAYDTDSCIFRKVLFKSGSVFSSTEKGIAIISPVSSPFRLLQSDLENINSIRTIYRQVDGSLLVASYKNRFVRVDEATDAAKPLSGEMVSCLIPWNKDTLLAGSELGLPQWYLPASNRLVPVFKNNRPPDNIGINQHVLCLLRENDSLVWAGAYGGCYLFNPVRGTIVKTIRTGADGPLQQLNVDDILRVGSNRFFATTEGIFAYSIITGHTRKLFTGTDDSYANAWYSCLQQVGNQVWAGSHGNGIMVFDTAGSILKKITTKDGLAGNTVFSLPASGGYVMAGTISGLSVINPQTGSIRNYSSSQSLPANEFNRSAWFVQGDTVYMGTLNGIIRFSVRQLQQAEAQAQLPVRLISYSFNDGQQTHYNYSAPYSSLSGLIVPAGTRSFSLSFGGLGEGAAELELYYRFGGDSAWQRIGQQREITFVGLAPSRYTVQVAARLPDGQWAGNMLTVPVVVRPAFYQTIWFKILLAAVGLGLLWLGIRYREKTLLKEQQLRSRIAGDLHDEVGSALTRIYFQAGMLTATEEEESANGNKPATALHKIASSSQEALSSMSDMVWSIDAHYDNAPDMVSRMRDYIARLQDELPDSRFIFEVSGTYETLRLSQMVRQNILLIFKEAVNNALKYGHPKTVAIQLSFHHQAIHLQVKNPLPQNKAATTVQGGHGLESMKLRAGKIKATFSAKAVQEEFVVELGVKVG